MKPPIFQIVSAVALGALLFVPAQAAQETAQSRPKTADDASNKPTDRQLMQKIRKAVLADDSLSTNAHNVKIIARNGKVTLKGAVNSPEERSNIEAKAVEFAGQGNVVNQVTVKGDKNRK